MNGRDDQAAEAAKRVYTQATRGGANVHVAFDLACNAYRLSHPDLEGLALHVAVARGIDLSREDMVKIDVGLHV